MERLPSFDDPPEPNRLSSLLLLLAIAASLAIVPAAVALGGTAAGRTFFGAMLAFAAYGVAREVSAVVLHTRYTLMDLWLGVMLCGTVAGGILAGMNEAIANINEPNLRGFAWASAAALVLLALNVVVKGLYLGLRMAMWLKAERHVQRFSLLLLGVVGYVAHFAWKLFGVVVLFLLVSLAEQKDIKIARIMALALVLSLFAGGIFYLITRAHLRYRKRAQENFEADPEGQGKAGRLTREGGRVGLMRVLGNAVGYVLRLLGGGRG